MSGDDEAPVVGNPADGLNEQLRQLEEFVSRAEAAGDDLPPEAVEMVEKLREIIRALEGLTSSLEVRGDAITLDEVSAPPPEHE
ncbi:MAG: hypothetical protein ABJE47_00880 [bacterium]